MEVLRAGYVETARRRVWPLAWCCDVTLRNALMPATTVLALNIGYLIGGTVIIETSSPSGSGADDHFHRHAR